MPPPSRTACRSKGRRPGAVLRVSRIRQVVPATASTNRRVGRRDAAHALEQVERHPLGRQDRPRAAGELGERRRRRDPRAGRGGLLPDEIGVEQLEDPARDGKARDDARGLRHELAPRRACRAGTVVSVVTSRAADVLGEEPRAGARRGARLRAPSRAHDSSSIRSSGFSAALRISSGSTISGRSSRRQR